MKNVCKRFILVAALLANVVAFGMGKQEVFIPKKLGKISLAHDDTGFKVIKNNQVINVQNAFIDKPLRQMSNDKLNKLVKSGAYLSLNKFENSEDYLVKLHARGKGGGPGGAYAGSVLGWFGVQLFGQGICLAVSAPVSFFATPAVGLAVHTAMSKTVMPLIQPLAYSVSIAGGIAGGVATGPV